MIHKIKRTDAEAETQTLWPPHEKSWLIVKESDARRDWGQEEKGMTENEMAGWHRWLYGHESGWTLGVGDGQGGLACWNSWGRKESDTTERLNWTEKLLTLWIPTLEELQWNSSWTYVYIMFSCQSCSFQTTNSFWFPPVRMSQLVSLEGSTCVRGKQLFLLGVCEAAHVSGIMLGTVTQQRVDRPCPCPWEAFPLMT